MDDEVFEPLHEADVAGLHPTAFTARDRGFWTEDLELVRRTDEAEDPAAWEALTKAEGGTELSRGLAVAEGRRGLKDTEAMERYRFAVERVRLNKLRRR